MQRIRQTLLWLHRHLLPEQHFLGWTPYFWLPYMGFLFINWLFRPVGTLEVAATLLTAAVFLVLYFRAYWVARERLILHASGIALLGLLLTPLNAGGLALIVYASAFAAQIVPMRRGAVFLAFVLGLAIIECQLLDFAWITWTPVMVIAASVGITNFYFIDRHKKDHALKASQEEIQRLGALAERERIARDLHDLLGHTLSVIALKSELAGRLLPTDSAAAQREIQDVEQVSRDALEQVRQAVTGYRAAGLDAELDSARSALQAADVAVEVSGDSGELPINIEVLLAMLLREAVTNIIRHARARHCRIQLTREAGLIGMRIEDDGRGGRFLEGNGLRGMRQRLQGVGGRLAIDSGAGTCLNLQIPLRGREEPA